MTDNAIRWAFDPADACAHVLTDQPPARPGSLVTICGRTLPAEHTTTFSVPPSLAICPTCRHSERVPQPPVMFPTPMHY